MLWGCAAGLALPLLGTVGSAHADETSADPPVQPVQATLETETDVRATVTWVRLLTTRFDAEAGERRKVSATVTATTKATVPDELLVLHAELRCGEAGASARSETVQYVNIWRGRTNSLTPEFSYTAAKAGRQYCHLYVRSGRPRPVGPSTGNKVTILPGTFLLVDHVHAEVAEYFRPQARSFLVARRSTALRSVSQLTWSAKSVPADAAAPRVIAIRGWVSLTACTTLSGSNDPVQDKQLCTKSQRSGNGSTVYLRTRVDQYDAAGRPCATTYINGSQGRYLGVSRTVHHSARSYTANVALQPGCVARLRIVTTLRWRSGAAMMVHAQGTLLTATPIDLSVDD
ncbi:hypothetical protein GCM10023349_29910 [Nocardioides conyzicola]|uniref:Ig-like domain-containing protein n=1 Tax=Nocardioides conyzicola TaxID=1651781 RepID=A0ABP8XJW7_9ACTN